VSNIVDGGGGALTRGSVGVTNKKPEADDRRAVELRGAYESMARQS